MDLRLKVNGLVKPRKSTWAERLIVGGRYVLTMSWNEVRDRPLFAMYFATATASCPWRMRRPSWS
jgi:hypothetical protein